VQLNLHPRLVVQVALLICTTDNFGSLNVIIELKPRRCLQQNMLRKRIGLHRYSMLLN